MAESWFALSREDRVEALEFAAARTGRPGHLLEKDIWMVWVLSALYESDLASKLTFKGGTSLSKVYRIIDRFSEDVDLTYDIRELAADLLKQGNPIPESASQEKRSATRYATACPTGSMRRSNRSLQRRWLKLGCKRVSHWQAKIGTS